MKKHLVLIALLLLITGCSVVRINTSNLDSMIDVILSKKNKLYNTDGQGYKYYIPNGVTHADTDDLINTLYYNGEAYYLYVDIISYYNKSKLKIPKSNNAYYFKKIDKHNNKGYVKVTKKGSLYYVVYVYNYSKIEALVSKEDLNNTILNATYILSTIKYDRNIIKTMLEEDYFTNRTGKYDAFKTKNRNEKFVLKKD